MLYSEVRADQVPVEIVVFPAGMKIQLILFASLARFLPNPEGAGFPKLVEIEEGTTIEGLLNRLKIPQKQSKIIFLNGIHAEGTTVLKEGDRLGIFPPLAGG
jgi:molybdopterin converting factor small subunit